MPTITATQAWLREYSVRLSSSYRSSALVRHTTTKGESRERQIVDVLRELLPTRCSIEEHVTIVDATGAQSNNFDAAIIDRDAFPLLAGEPMSVMVESVLTAIETKSTLDSNAVSDIFAKTESLRSLEFESGGADSNRGLVTGFAYGSDNLNLRFFDFSLAAWQKGRLSPSGICVLNQGYFGWLDESQGSDGPRPADAPRRGALPCFYQVQEDALLLYIYFLTKWVTAGTPAAGIYLRYSQEMFRGIKPFRFERSFLKAIADDTYACEAAREVFEGQAASDPKTIYAAARRAVRI